VFITGIQFLTREEIYSTINKFAPRRAHFRERERLVEFAPRRAHFREGERLVEFAPRRAHFREREEFWRSLLESASPRKEENFWRSPLKSASPRKEGTRRRILNSFWKERILQKFSQIFTRSSPLRKRMFRVYFERIPTIFRQQDLLVQECVFTPDGSH